MREAIARDQGYSAFKDVPKVRARLIEEFVRLCIRSDLLWLSALHTGRDPDRSLDIANAIERYGKTLGLDRLLKDATIDVGAELARPAPGGEESEESR